MFRMEPAQFDKLFDEIRSDLSRQAARNTTGNFPIEPEQRLAITLRYLAGGQVLDLLDMAPACLSTVYQIIWSTIDAINACKTIALPEDLDDAKKCPRISAP